MNRPLSFVAVIVLLAISCTKQNQVSTVPLNETIDSVTISVDSITVLYKGMFSNGPYGTVTGAVSIYRKSDNSFQLGLNSIAVSNGPDLHVYLSQERLPVNFIDLGKLRSTAGNQLYDIKGSPDLNLYRYVLIHCQQYNHLFGSAELKK